MSKQNQTEIDQLIQRARVKQTPTEIFFPCEY